MDLREERYITAKWRLIPLSIATALTLFIGGLGLVRHDFVKIIVGCALTLYYLIWWYDTIYDLRRGPGKRVSE